MISYTGVDDGAFCSCFVIIFVESKLNFEAFNPETSGGGNGIAKKFKFTVLSASFKPTIVAVTENKFPASLFFIHEGPVPKSTGIITLLITAKRAQREKENTLKIN
jgi:hypothetical protein